MKYLCLLLLLAISGCTAMGVSSTNDPYKKLQQSYQLMASNRPIPAEFNAKEALQLFTEKKDIFGQAEANFFLGVFYKAKSGWGNTDKNKMINTSVSHLTKATNSYKSLNENIQASKAVFELANAYRGLEDKNNYCKYYKESLSLYSSGVGQHKTFKINYPNFKTPKDLIQFHYEKLCSNNA